MSDLAEDPICGAWVKRDTAVFSEYEGEYYYFCSLDCKEEFDDDPERYVGWGGTSRYGSA